jgi:primosomal protein N' (replication factor Y)
MPLPYKKANNKPPSIVRVAVPSPLRKVFDYRVDEGLIRGDLKAGMRVEVIFGRRHCQALVVAIATGSSVPESKLKSVEAMVDTAPLVTTRLLNLLVWAGEYYQHPLGEVIFGALPTLLRQGKPAEARGEDCWLLTERGKAVDAESLKRAPRQISLLQMLAVIPDGLTASAIDAQQPQWRPIMRKLIDKGWVETRPRTGLAPGKIAPPSTAPVLNEAQAGAVAAVSRKLGKFGVYLLDGVTGSGKTEVYLTLIEQVLARGEQALILAPEIGLTPQLLLRFQQRFGVSIAVMHSGLSDRERLTAWVTARDGHAPIVIGTRSAVFTPLPKLGLIILDEEHDLSFKQQDGFRYSARDVAVKRAHMEGIPVMLGSATPSLESLYNAEQGRYQRLVLPERAGMATHPQIAVLDVRKQPMQAGLSAALLNTTRHHLDAGGQVLLFLNRRGYAPALLCHDCGWVAKCRRCDANMTLYNTNHRLRCHHCGTERPADRHCPDCRSTELRPVGAGTERLEEALQQQFPNVGIARIDRDTTRRKGAMQSLLDSIHDGSNRILVGTQMLAKGHHFPEVTLVGIIDIDQGLFSADFRATERMAQLIVQVAGRAGRAEKAGQVLIQTHHPDHPLLQVLLHQGYAAYAQAALEERRQAILPPYGHMALLRAEAVEKSLPLQFLSQARELAEQLRVEDVELLGPIPAPMEKRAGRFRAQLMLQANSRAELHRLLTPWVLQLESGKLGRKVRWSIDVDPQETF